MVNIAQFEKYKFIIFHFKVGKGPNTW